MAEKLIVGPFNNKGLQTNVKPFNVDNTSFPTLVNAYQWRGQIKRKRGTSLLNRLSRYFSSSSTAFGSISSFNLVAGAGNLLTGFGLQANGNIIPGTVTFTDSTSGDVYTDPAMDGTLIGAPGGIGTINYATGAITITGGGADVIDIASFRYYPDLPVMGFRDFNINSTQFPGNIAFDTVYAYNVINSSPYPVYNVSFYKNPVADVKKLPGYVPKGVAPLTTETPLKWNGQNYQQFYTVNYQGALWATNGITVPFTTTNIGMQFSKVTHVAAPIGNTVVITVSGPNLVVGDFVFLNEFDPAIITGVNFQTGYVIAGSAPGAITIELPFATLAGAGGATTLGIVQYLTNNSDKTKDCIRWYDGDPTDGVLIPQGFTQGKGWVNFMPPLSWKDFSISGLPADQYYLVGAKIIFVYKDRLIFFGPVVQTSSGDPIYLQDTAIFSQNGTPYYTSSFKYTSTPEDPTLADIEFHEILVPINQTATASSWFEDQTGFGGYISAGIDEPIFTVGSNEDALIVGFDNVQTRFVYTGNDIIPFLFYIINSELGSSSTFSVIQMDQGVLSRGDRGLTITGQTQTQRIDLDIPDEVFQMQMVNNGSERICSARDFINEWAYFTYPANNKSDDEGLGYVFPTKTLLYNYRDVSWAIFFECYTCYGQFNRQTGFTWATVGDTYPTWSSWNDPWDAGESTLLQPEVVGGNQQGFLIAKDQGTDEAKSLYIRSFSGSTITSPDHCLNEGDFIIITGCIGTIGQQVNGKIFQINPITSSTFRISPTITSGTYFGGGLITRMYIPFIQTKQFPSFWGQGKKTRIGMQQYLLDKTASSEITLLIFLSQNADSPYNDGNIVPQNFPLNSSLIYSTVLFTCPESTNLGLTPYTKSLQSPEAEQQAQIWHRINTSLIGDTVQLGFTLSEDQMRHLTPSSQSFTITGATKASNCVLTTNANFGAGQLIKITGVIGMTQLNGNIYNVISSTETHTTIEVDSSAFTNYISGGTAVVVSPLDQFAEIVLHGFIMDLSSAGTLS